MTRVLDYRYLDFSHFPRPQILPKYKYELNFIKAYTDFFFISNKYPKRLTETSTGSQLSKGAI